MSAWNLVEAEISSGSQTQGNTSIHHKEQRTTSRPHGQSGARNNSNSTNKNSKNLGLYCVQQM